MSERLWNRETARPRLGHIGLDRYKDWILDWPEGPAVV
jgi:hypothetical protein